MRHLIYCALMLLLGFAWYKFGQNLLRKAPRDESGERTKELLGPFGFLVTAGITCFLGLGYAMYVTLKMWSRAECAPPRSQSCKSNG